jgi:hypothetical protein
MTHDFISDFGLILIRAKVAKLANDDRLKN